METRREEWTTIDHQIWRNSFGEDAARQSADWFTGKLDGRRTGEKG